MAKTEEGTGKHKHKSSEEPFEHHEASSSVGSEKRGRGGEQSGGKKESGEGGRSSGGESGG